MNDQNKFVNAYIEASVATLHDYLNQLLQTKAQLKVTTDMVSHLQAELNNTKTELEQSRNTHNEKDSVIRSFSQLEHINNALQNKVSHLDTALNQISEMKKNIADKDEVIKNLETQIDELKSAKKVINRKKLLQENKKSIYPELSKTDDF